MKPIYYLFCSLLPFLPFIIFILDMENIDTDMSFKINLSSYLTAKLSYIILPLLYPLHKISTENEIHKLRQIIEPLHNIHYTNTNITDIKLKNIDHRHNQEIYLDKDKRILYRLYIPKYYNKSLNVVIWFHGGGFVLGNIRDNDDVCKKISEETNTIVVNVNYALSPENKFPKAIYDSIHAVKWVYSNIHKYNGNKNSIYLAGESAGGNLIISIIPNLNIKIKGIISIYAPLQAYTFTNSHWKYANFNGLLSLDNLLKFYDLYLPNAMYSQDYRVSPILMKKHMLKKFPKVLFILAEYDILHDDSIIFANKLIQYKIPTIVKSYPDIHGFFNRGGYSDKAFMELKKFII